MKSKEFIVELFGFGNNVSGRAVAKVLQNNTWHRDDTIKGLTQGITYKKKQLSPAEARNFLSITAAEGGGDYWEEEKEDTIRNLIRSGKFDYENHPSIVHTGFIWDGRHRMKVALEEKHPIWALVAEVKE